MTADNRKPAGPSDRPTESRASYSLFQEPWWLDAVAPGGWDEVEVRSDGHLTARLPFVTRRRRGLTELTSPPMTKTLGPWLAPAEGKYTNLLARQMEALQELIGKLPKFDVFRQAFAPELMNWLPFHWHGFRASGGVTYRLEDLSSVDEIWRGLRENIRREVRKAERQLTIVDDLGVDRFLETAALTFGRQSMASPIDSRLMHRIDEAAGRRNQRRILFAVDDHHRVHAAVYLVWDERVFYYLAGGADADLRTSGASSLAMWTAIRHAAEVSACFDFEGSMSEPIERYFRAFGARQVPYLVVSRHNRRAAALSAMRQLVGALRGS